MQALEGCGWEVTELTSYPRMAAESGHPAEAFTDDMQAGGFHDRETFFIVANVLSTKCVPHE